MGLHEYFSSHWSTNISYLIIKIGPWYKLSQEAQKTHILSNCIIIIYLNPKPPYEPNAHIPFYIKPKNTYAWQYLKSPWFKSMAKFFYQWNSNLISKAHGLNPWQFIYHKPNSHWQYQKPNLHWQHKKPQFSLATSKAQFTLAISKA